MLTLLSDALYILTKAQDSLEDISELNQLLFEGSDLSLLYILKQLKFLSVGNSDKYERAKERLQERFFVALNWAWIANCIEKPISHQYQVQLELEFPLIHFRVWSVPFTVSEPLSLATAWKYSLNDFSIE